MRFLMRAVVAALVSTLLLLASAMAQPRPDFSGDWKMNAAKSNFGGGPSPTSMTRKITHVEPKITIVEAQSGGVAGEQNLNRTFTTDGKDITISSGGVDLRSSAAWEGSAMVVTTNVDVASVVYSDRMTLSDDRRELRSEVTLSSPQGQIQVTIVFDRQ